MEKIKSTFPKVETECVATRLPRDSITESSILIAQVFILLKLFDKLKNNNNYNTKCTFPVVFFHDSEASCVDSIADNT